MENDESAVTFDTITCHSGKFGFFQKRLFIINTLIQSACISVLLYTCACMPEVDETEVGHEPGFILASNGNHVDQQDNSSGDTEATIEPANLISAVQDAADTLAVNLDFMYQNLSNFAFTMMNNFSQSNSVSSVNTTVNSSLEYVMKNVRQLASSTTMSLDYDLETRSTAEGLVDTESFSTHLRTENLSNHLQEKMKAVNALTSDITSISLDTFFNMPASTHISAVGAESKTDVWQRSTSYLALENITERLVADQSISRENSSKPEATTFIVFRKGLQKTQIFENLNKDDLERVTSYAQSTGLILGALVGSMMADIFGRRRLLYVSLAGMLALHCLVALSISWIMFIFLRIITVGCAGATLVISFVTVIEFVGPDWRDICMLSSFWTLGAILLCLQTLVTLNWRCFALLSGGICLPLIATFFTSIESLRWLQCQHRFAEAEWGFRELVSVNSDTIPDLVILLDKSRGCIVNNMHVKKFSYLDLVYSLDSAKWTVALVYTCTISSTVYFCLLWRVKAITGLGYIDGFLPFVIDLPLTWSIIIMNRCLGRRWCLFLYSVASGFALISVLVLHLTGNMDVLPSLVTGLALFGKVGVTASMSLIFLTAIEMYPTVTRCMGVAVALASASAGSMLYNVLHVLECYHYTVPFVAYGAMMSSVGLVGLVLPETMSRPLKNIQQCRHRKIPLMEGVRLVGRPPSLWDAV